MLIGIIIVGKVYYGFHLTTMETVKAIGITIILGIIFETIIMYIYNRVMYGDSDEPK